MTFKYDLLTKNAYKNAGTARRYHDAFTGKKNWKSLRAHFIATRERRVVGSFLRRIGARRVLDIPCGTGKLASVAQELAIDVVAADISPEMLELAKESYGATSIAAKFALCDAERVHQDIELVGLDAVVSLRLMHRVPQEVRSRMFTSFAKAAKYSIISFGLSSIYHRARKRLRNFIFRESPQQLCLQTMRGMEVEVAPHFTIIETRHVSPALSEEVVMLLKSRQFC
ncbi:MAG: methyltransferase domain-containing protein [Nitrospiraceae bacterium]